MQNTTNDKNVIVQIPSIISMKIRSVLYLKRSPKTPTNTSLIRFKIHAVKKQKPNPNNTARLPTTKQIKTLVKKLITTDIS